MSAGKWKCPWCKGIVRAGRRVSLDEAIDRHEASCPSTPKVAP